MSKRLTIIIGALFLALCFVPVVSAETSDDVAVMDTEPILINEKKDLSGHGWNWNYDDRILTITDDIEVPSVQIDYDGSYGPDDTGDEITIQLDKKLTVQSDNGMMWLKVLGTTITGNGSLEIDTESMGIYGVNLIIANLDSVVINSEIGIVSMGDVTFKNIGKVSMECIQGCISCKNCTIQDCNDFCLKVTPEDAEKAKKRAGIAITDGQKGNLGDDEKENVSEETKEYKLSIKDSYVEVTSTYKGVRAFGFGYMDKTCFEFDAPKGDVSFADTDGNPISEWDRNKVKTVLIEKDGGTAIVGEKKSSSDNTPMIIGIAAVVVIAAIAGACYYFFVYKKKKDDEAQAAPAEPKTEEPKTEAPKAEEPKVEEPKQ